MSRERQPASTVPVTGAAWDAFETLRRHAAAAPGDGVTLLDPRPADDGVTFGNDGGLVGGRLGVAVFTAALARVAPDAVGLGEIVPSTAHSPDAVPDRPAAWTRRLTTHLFETDPETLVADRPLGTTGVGGVVYGLAALSTITGDDRYARRGTRLLEALPAERVQTATAFDTATGVAGLCHAALASFERTDAAVARETAVRCGERLLDARIHKWGYEVWDTLPNDETASFTTGFAHGAAGVAAALHRLVGVCEGSALTDDELAEAAAHALGFEEVLYDPARNDWRANWAAQPDYPDRWCFGAPGVALARLVSLRALPETHPARDAVVRDLRRVAAREPTLPADDTLCDGAAGHLDCHLELARAGLTDRGDARRLCEAALSRARERGVFAVPYAEYGPSCNPTLFYGVAGVGYQLLRLVASDRLPSVLRLG